jgi:hypothetical protein
MCDADFFQMLEDGRLKLRDIRTSVLGPFFDDCDVGDKFLARLNGTHEANGTSA